MHKAEIFAKSKALVQLIQLESPCGVSKKLLLRPRSEACLFISSKKAATSG